MNWFISKIKAIKSASFPRWQNIFALFLLILFLMSPLAIMVMSFLRNNTTTSHHQEYYHFKLNSLTGIYLDGMDLFRRYRSREVDQQIAKIFPRSMHDKVKVNMKPILFLSQKHQVDPFWILSIIWTESHFRHHSVSHAGASGLMQIMPETFEELLRLMKGDGVFLEADRGDRYLRLKYPEYDSFSKKALESRLKNIEAGIVYLKKLLMLFEHDYHLATISYNMGPYWTKNRLRKKRPVGVKNDYLSKVLRRYHYLMKKLDLNIDMAMMRTPSKKIKTIIKL